MRAVLIGNCQVDGLARCMKVMAPSLRVTGLHVHQIDREPEKHRADLDAADLIFTQTHRAASAMRGAFPDHAKRSIVYPRVWFPGYHPDLRYVRDAGGVQVQPHVSDAGYHSRLAFAAFRAGLAPERAISLFTAETYETAGYFDAWAPAEATFAAEAAQSDLDMHGAVERWARRGCFMLSVNHPKLYVLADIARAMLERVGLQIRTPRPERYETDILRTLATWPLYPEIAARFGFEGDYLFKLESGALLDLTAFVQASYQAYAQVTEFQRDAEPDPVRDLVATIARGARALTRQPKQEEPLGISRQDHPYSDLPS